ncbi:uncharacterized protein TNCV_876911 [Trichonephila clavipes]|nr:uncharacterized protein TNCV_876911 [Trichonephila clavipes]
MFSDESSFSLQSDSRRTLIWRAPGTRYHQENTIERHRYGGAGWLAFAEEFFLVSELTYMFRVACVGYAWPTNCSPSTPSHLSTGTLEAFGGMPRRCKACIASSGRHSPD